MAFYRAQKKRKGIRASYASLPKQLDLDLYDRISAGEFLKPVQRKKPNLKRQRYAEKEERRMKEWEADGVWGHQTGDPPW